MKKKILRILCIVSGVAAAVLTAVLGIRAAAMLEAMGSGPSVGIIGGADWPTLGLLLRYLLFGTSLFWWWLASLILFVATLIILRLRRK